MLNKIIATALAIIIVLTSAAGYVVYTGISNNANHSPTPTPTPTPSPTPTAIPNPTATPTASPIYSSTANPAPTPTPVPVDLRVDIASSLIHVVQNMSSDFEKANNVHLIINSDSSSALYTQIVAGSPCDVFMSADQKWTKQLNSSDLLYNNNYVNFTTNSLSVIIAQGNPKVHNIHG